MTSKLCDLRNEFVADLAGDLRGHISASHCVPILILSSGFVSQNSEGRYTTGDKCRDLLRLMYLRDGHANSEISKTVEELSIVLNESVLFACVNDGLRRIIAEAVPKRMVKVDTSYVYGTDPYVYMTGRLVLAMGTEAQLCRTVERRGFPGDKWDGINDMRALRKACSKISEKGFCVVCNELDEAYSFSYPVFDDSGDILGALGCFAPSFRCLKKDVKRVKQIMSEKAEELGHSISGKGAAA